MAFEMKIEQINSIRARWINSLFELAHREYQIRLWIEDDYENAIGSYSECLCKYFDDLDLVNGYEDFLSEGIISKLESDIVLELHSEFSSYSNRIDKKNLSDNKILMDPEWMMITKLALQTWNKLKEIIQSEKEKKLMVEIELDYLNKNAT